METDNTTKKQPVGFFSRKYFVKFKIIPYILLLAGLGLSVFEWWSAKEAVGSSVDRTFPFGIFFIGVSVTLFVVGLLFLYIKSYEWASIMADATTRQLRANSEELAQKVEIIEEKNKNLKKAEQSTLKLMKDISEEKIKIEALLESIGDGVISTDNNEVIQVVNHSAETMLGWKAEEMKGKKFSEIVKVENENNEAVPLKDHPIAQAILTEEKFTSLLVHPLYYVRKNKTRFPAAVVTSPVVLNKKISGAIMVFRDITKEWDIDKSKTEFVSLASHQLRTPISTIGWYSEMLLDGDAGKLTKEQQSYMKEIYEGNVRMAQLVNSLLNVSRIELGTLAIETEMTDFSSICDSVVKELALNIKKKEIQLTKEYEEKIPTINADPKLVRIIFQNLLTNAVKYTPEKGEIYIKITKKGTDLLISVADNGYGIPEHQKNKIFTKLFRADNAREKETEGTGLGLYIVKLIIEAAKGKIWFESEENKGTTFYVLMPLAGMSKKAGSKKLIEYSTK